MRTITKEYPSTVYSKLEKYIYHTHTKNAKLVDGKINYVVFEKGDVPIVESIDVLDKSGCKGYYSFEWENHGIPKSILGEPPFRQFL